ncbi:hypothetical protein L3Q82_003865 [Scortum barcoo]|uniref:Uncharacterized protein n=1 Tax=Scortum barcoo TaxID=214431 RepID=A0ACB8X6E7_9TELE|nr:hypothetical protein L3Q82_003865 [Scortum barcoo]
MVILDGLDESRLQLDFENKPVTSVSEVTSVGNVLVNLIQGNLLPHAKVWITSRPAAANQIPAKFVDMVTEIRGFSDPQKEEYFKRRFSPDLTLANRIISHIRSSQTLDIMCQIPIFCWISAVLFQEIFGVDEKAETPQTLTEMMAHFLFAQTKRRSRKYDKKTEENNERLLKKHREFLLKLSKLAFVQLQKNNLIFYDEDLEDCGIDITEATIYSGFCTAVFREEQVFSQKKVFFFVHLTIQEFFAALFVYDCFTNKNTKELGSFLDLKDKEHTLLDLVKMTVDKVSEKKNGHLDFFLRFLLGLMVESNRRVLQGLLTSPDTSQETDKKILTHLRAIRRKALSPDSCINLFQTMVEMRDHKVKDEIQEYLKLSDRSKTELTPLHCSALAYMLQVSKDDLDELDMKSYNTSDEGRRRLIPAVRISRKAILSGCLVTETGCAYLASALKSNPSHLMELDLSYNNPGDSGEKLLTELRNDSHYMLSNLSLAQGGSHRMKPGLKKYALDLTFDPNSAHKNLLLSEDKRKVTWVEEEQPYPCHTERQIENCLHSIEMAEKKRKRPAVSSDESFDESDSFCSESSARQQNREASSSSVRIEDPVHFTKLHRDTEEGMFTEENIISKGKRILKKAMQRQFTLTYEGHGDKQNSLNNIYTVLYITAGDNGDPCEEHVFRHVKQDFLKARVMVILDGLDESRLQLDFDFEQADRSKTELTPLHCSALAYMLQVSKDDLDELDLKSYNTSDEGRRRLIPAVRISRKAILAHCKVTAEWVEHLAFALKYLYSALRDLDLSNNDLKDSGVEILCDGLSSHCCRLETLWLSGCLVTETGCAFLALALQSNPSNLTELDLSYNNPGDSGEKLLTELRNNPQYKLSKLK